jgi:transporter family protein
MEEPNVERAGWVMFALGSAFFAALTAILGKLGVAEINSNLATLIRTVVIFVITAGIVWARNDWEPIGRLSRFGATMLLLSGLATGLSWLCYYRALQMAPASRVAPVDKLSVVLVILFAILFLREPITLRLAVGGLLVTAGVVVLSTT